MLPPWSSGDQPLAIGTSLMASTATDDYVAAIVTELQEAVARLSPNHTMRLIKGDDDR